MRRLGLAFATATIGLMLGFSSASAKDICTLIADPVSRTIVLSEGDCTSRVTPASTFKLPLAIMGFDAGLLKSADVPVMTFKPGDPDWGGASWRGDVTPRSWMKNSVLWYSQRLTQQLGADKIADYAQRWGYGNADFSGDPGQNNGLERSWVSSSLQISPVEQAGFVAALIEHKLPVSRQAMDQALGLVDSPGQASGWQIWGKTGSAYPRRADRSFDYARGWGWYVGWAEKGAERLVFVRLAQDEKRHEVTGGLRARDALVKDWPALLSQMGR